MQISVIASQNAAVSPVELELLRTWCLLGAACKQHDLVASSRSASLHYASLLLRSRQAMQIDSGVGGLSAR